MSIVAHALLALVSSTYTVELVHYHKDGPTAVQSAAWDTRDTSIRAAVLRRHVWSRVRLTLLPGQKRRINNGQMRGTIQLVGPEKNRAIKLDIPDFYRGSPFKFTPCKEHKLVDMRRRSAPAMLDLRTLRVDDGTC